MGDIFLKLVNPAKQVGIAVRLASPVFSQILLKVSKTIVDAIDAIIDQLLAEERRIAYRTGHKVSFSPRFNAWLRDRGVFCVWKRGILRASAENRDAVLIDPGLQILETVADVTADADESGALVFAAPIAEGAGMAQPEHPGRRVGVEQRRSIGFDRSHMTSGKKNGSRLPVILTSEPTPRTGSSLDDQRVLFSPLFSSSQSLVRLSRSLLKEWKKQIPYPLGLLRALLVQQALQVCLRVFADSARKPEMIQERQDVLDTVFLGQIRRLTQTQVEKDLQIRDRILSLRDSVSSFD